ncbi:MAG: hypothetical protein QMB94_13440 [Phycisphaerales bacterium]
MSDVRAEKGAQANSIRKALSVEAVMNQGVVRFAPKRKVRGEEARNIFRRIDLTGGEFVVWGGGSGGRTEGELLDVRAIAGLG